MPSTYPGKRNNRVIKDPRRVHGAIVGPGLEPGEHKSRHSVVIDAENAVLLDSCSVALVDPIHDGQSISEIPWWYLLLEGRINSTQERAEIGFLMDEEGAATVLSEIIALATRMGPEVAHRLMASLDRKFRALKGLDAMSAVPEDPDLTEKAE